jgi:hypothetical protein
VSMNLSPRVDFFYNGNDTEPYKKVLTTPFLTAVDEEYSNDTSFYFYTNGILTGDSAIRVVASDKFTEVRKFVYNSNKIITTATDYNFNSPSGYTRTDTLDFLYANGNIMRQTRNFWQFGHSDDRTFLYDAHVNPFYATQSKIATNNVFPYFRYWEEEIEVPDVFAKNNPLEINEVVGTFYSSHATLTYQYKANGYPKTVLSINDEMNLYYRGVYIYTN